MAQISINDLESFNNTCPSALDVSHALESIGFKLAFHMDAFTPPESSNVPALPPQYHYSDQYGTEIIYLAGRDTPEYGQSYPAHESRFWLYVGSDLEAFSRAASFLEVKWRVNWYSHAPHATRQHQQIA